MSHPHSYEQLIDTSPEASSLLEEMSRQHLAFLGTKKTCRICGEAKPRSAFGVHSHSTDGRDSRCRDCKNRHARLRSSFRKDHPAPPPGECPLCKRYTEKWVIDHCHERDEPRGYCCDRCNVSLGGFYDDPDILRRALEWVTKDDKPSIPYLPLPRHLL